MTMELTRQRDLINLERLSQIRILMIGAGGIGSFAAHALAKMGVENLQVWDKDLLESHNIPNQNFNLDQVGKSKVEALQHNIYEATHTNINAKYDFFTSDISYQPDIIISGVDSMVQRKLIYDGLKEETKSQPIYYLDARMSARAMSVFALRFDNPKSMERYASSLYSDAEAEQERCTAKSIIHTPYACAYVLGTIVHAIINNTPVYGSYHGILNDMRFTKEKFIINN